MGESGYYAYQNKPSDRVTLHHGSCRHCNYGWGKRSFPSTENGTWHGPFLSRGDARFFARTLSQTTIRDCKVEP